jgi:SAM-dependent methyltransferase
MHFTRFLLAIFVVAVNIVTGRYEENGSGPIITQDLRDDLFRRSEQGGIWPQLFVLNDENTADRLLRAVDYAYVLFGHNDSSVGSGELHALRLRFGDSVYTKVKATCPDYHENDRCVKIAAQMSQHLYGGAYYAPTLPRSNYRDFVAARGNILHELLNRYGYKRYLEIGCDLNDAFKYMKNLAEVAVGVDPASGGTHRMTSDAFFATNDQYFDLIFIDGLHEANQVYRDFRNAIQWLSPGGTIVFHDCNPSTESFASFPRHDSAQHYWNGDTWKAAVALRLHMDVDMVVVDVDHGVGVLRRGENRHPLSSQWQELLGASPLSMLQWEHLKNHRDELLTLVTVDEFVDWLEEQQ